MSDLVTLCLNGTQTSIVGLPEGFKPYTIVQHPETALFYALAKAVAPQRGSASDLLYVGSPEMLEMRDVATELTHTTDPKEHYLFDDGGEVALIIPKRGSAKGASLYSAVNSTLLQGGNVRYMRLIATRSDLGWK